MTIKTTLKKLKRGDVVSIDWIDGGILMILRPVGSLKKMQKKSSKRYLSKQLRSILVMEKKIYFWCVILKDKTSKVLISMVLALFLLDVLDRSKN